MNLSHGKPIFYCGGGGFKLESRWRGGGDVPPKLKMWIHHTGVESDPFRGLPTHTHTHRYQVEVVGVHRRMKNWTGDLSISPRGNEFFIPSAGRRELKGGKLTEIFWKVFCSVSRGLKLEFGAIKLHKKMKLIQYFSNIK